MLIRREPSAPGQARVIGSLTGDTVQVLLEAVSSGVSVLDLSEVNEVDHTGVRALARLWLERCTLVGCPRWLEVRLLLMRPAVEGSQHACPVHERVEVVHAPGVPAGAASCEKWIACDGPLGVAAG